MLKLQAAMEYLVTYGWAIIIIVVALAVLYSLGVFNPNTYVVRAQPGSCQVLRPEGPGTLQFINFEGTCSEGIPKFVGFFRQGISSASIPSTQIINVTHAITIGMWIYSNKTTGTQIAMSKASSSSNLAFVFPEISYSSPGVSNIIAMIDTSQGGWQTLSAHYTGGNVWVFVTLTYNGTVMNIYVDGALAATSRVTGAITTSSSNLTVGDETGLPDDWFSGEIANIQIYNNSLGANSVESLYREGIGGPPINLQYLVGWWPLNGDIVDYSGNGASGTANSMYFSTSWTSGYTPGVQVTAITTTTVTTTSTTTSTTTTSTSTTTSTTTSVSTSTSTSTSTSVSTSTSTSTSTTVTVTTIPYVPIVLTNSQADATGSPFQQMITVDSQEFSSYINSNWNNVEFTTGPDGTGQALQAWVESGALNTAPTTIVWVLLPFSVDGGGTSTIYMNFMSNSVMSFAGPTGEAPQLSGTYGQYDNGAEVFTNYWNFSYGSGWTSYGGVTATFNDGLTLNDYPWGGEYSAATITAGETIDAMEKFNNYNVYGCIGQYNGGLGFCGQEGEWFAIGYIVSGGVEGWDLFGGSPQTGVWYTMTGEFLPVGEFLLGSGNNNDAMQLDYTALIAMPWTIHPSNIFLNTYNGQMAYQWLRTRVTPPDGVMPSVSFGTGGGTITSTATTTSTTTSISTSTSTTTSTSTSISTSTSTSTSTTTTIIPPFAIDSFAFETLSGTPGGPGVLSAGFGVSTSNAPDLLTLEIATEALPSNGIGVVSSVSDNKGNIWHRRSIVVNSLAVTDEEVWYTLAPSKVSSDSLTITFSNAIDGGILYFVAVSGINSVTPWDSDVALPGVAASGTSGVPTVAGISTSGADDMIWAWTGFDKGGYGYEGPESGFTGLGSTTSSGGTNYYNGALEYEVATSAQSSTTITFSNSAPNDWTMIVDAICPNNASC